MLTEETQRGESAPVVPRADELAFLQMGRVARFATVGRDNVPHLVPICYAIGVANGVLTTIDIALDEKPKRVAPGELRRVRNLTANPAVSLLIDRYDDGDWAQLAFLRVDGQARIVEPGANEHAPAVTALRAKYPQYRAMALAERPIIRITPIGLRSWGPLPTAQERPPRALPFPTLVQARRSVRRFRPHPVPRALVEELIAAAGWAPSPHGRQPWRFAVITRPAARAALADAMGATWTAQLALDGQDRATVEARLEGSRQRLLTTPTLIIPCLYTADLDRYPDRDRQAAEETMAIQSLGAAIQNLLLAATARGLDTGWMCAPLFCPEVVRDTLGLAAGLVPHALIQLGWAAQDPRRRDRLPPERLIAKYD
ncbi:MAG TPA: TIGR03668 family PPOX class F420-dependent oxidoreductase [Thermomicrobiales bacterium]|jgi:PPOX class probable F420-dependent enzyme